MDSDTRAIARVDAVVVDFRVCGTEKRVCGSKTEGVSYAILGRRCRFGRQGISGGETRGLEGAMEGVLRQDFQFVELQG